MPTPYVESSTVAYTLQLIPKSPPVCRIFSANLCFIRKVHILIRRMEGITSAIFRVRIRILSFRYLYRSYSRKNGLTFNFQLMT